MTRAEHLQRCKDKALEYVERGDLSEAWMSMVSDLSKHEKTSEHPAIKTGTQLVLMGSLSTANEMEKFILGFN